ncbi:MAG TPA: MgtC/SapB family protein [Candidatus Dorea intestinavium]|nr:MgtC/SapB family protein [Candidatus Dorea intestinavium]
MFVQFLDEMQYFLRILGAALCGAMIGYERESHMKMAGIRTHAIVAMASALMMVISKYGFFDVLLHPDLNMDPSRIASSIVTAVGFLGAGVIFVRNKNIIGVTTAAGIWATVGIGMCFGSGLYFLGISTTLFILLLQWVFHLKNLSKLSNSIETITFQIRDDVDVNEFLKDLFPHHLDQTSNISATRIDKNTIEVKIFIKFPETFEVQDVIRFLQKHKDVIRVDL